MEQLPILYNETKSGKIKEWSIKVNKIGNKSIIVINTGFIDGKMTTFEVEITTGKNLGKINETTAHQQALSEAKSKYNKKIDCGYTTNKTGKSHTLVYPMLAQDFKKHSNKLKFPDVYFQPKLDGIRAVYEEKKFHSRKLKIFPHLDHLTKELKELDKVNELKDTKGIKLILDGELYCHNLNLEVISGIVQKETLSEADTLLLNKIKFMVYDIVNDEIYSKRLEFLKNFFKEKNFKNIVFVETKLCKSKEQAKIEHDHFVSNGYEGLILRNANGKYEQNSRSYSLQKYKVFDDAEFEVIDFTEGKGKEKGAIIWIFKTKENKTFDARPIGSIEERKRIYKNGKDYIGKFITVKYFGLTENKIPKLPVSHLVPRCEV